jgi:tryptophan-rich sensory protein
MNCEQPILAFAPPTLKPRLWMWHESTNGRFTVGLAANEYVFHASKNFKNFQGSFLLNFGTIWTLLAYILKVQFFLTWPVHPRPGNLSWSSRRFYVLTVFCYSPITFNWKRPRREKMCTSCLWKMFQSTSHFLWNWCSIPNSLFSRKVFIHAQNEPQENSAKFATKIFHRLYMRQWKKVCELRRDIGATR